MKFPAINISEEVWEGEYLVCYLLSNHFINTGSRYFEKFLEGKEFCDCQGDIYKAVAVKILPKTWKRFLPAFFGLTQSEVLFRKTSRRMKLEELRVYLLEKIRPFEDEKWEERIRSAKSFEELMS
ncbi:MAG: hypothetical protein AAF696_19835 [Bacteroidota bacterium]